MRRWLNLLLRAGQAWQADNAFKQSAAVSFYTLFSLAPMTGITVGIAGLFLGKAAAAKQFSAQMTQLVGQQGAQAIQATMVASQSHRGDWVSTTAGVALLLIGATSVFVQLQDSLNEIWGVRAEPNRSGWATLVAQRMISFGMVLAVGFLLLVSLVVTTALDTIVATTGGELRIPPLAAQGIDLLVGLALITALFAAFFKILPDVRLTWRSVWESAFLTAILFNGGRFLIALYLGHSTVASVYGAAASLVALLVWIYYSCAIMFFGVEFMRASFSDRGLPVRPKKTAVLVRPVEAGWRLSRARSAALR